MKLIPAYCFAVLLHITSLNCIAQTSALVAIGSNGKLVYTADIKGNVIPDFSGVGYMNSEAPIPVVPVVLTVNAVAGDNVANVQNAINTVAAMPLQANGFRGAILFTAGTYGMSSTINVTASGIVIRGEGTATNFRATGTTQYDLLLIKGASGKTDVSSTQKQITDAFVPIGTKSVTVESGHSFAVGDWVHVRREPNAAWIQLLGMDTLTRIDPLATNWTASAYKISYERKITNVTGNVLTFDAPVMDIIDTAYAKGYVVKFNSSRIENCAVENLAMSSTYISSTDESHGWTALFFDNIKNAWAKNITGSDFGYSCVNVGGNAVFVTVDSCSMLDPVSIITGGRRYCFNVDGQRSLVQNCTTRNGRHDYVDGSRTPGPNVFYNCTATLQHADMGPHHRWSTGILFDNISGDGQLRVQNRLASGSGHGWSGSQIMFWNCNSTDMVVQDPPSFHQNWAIGCIGPITNVGQWATEPLGIVESNGTHITAIPSLFIAQLNERIRQDQTISFAALPAKVYGDADFAAGATASSGLAVSYTSSNSTAATIVNNQIHIVGVGTSDITASQTGNTNYNGATPVTQTLTVSKANQFISFAVLPTKVYGDADFAVGASASSGLAVSYTSSNAAVATIISNQIHIVGAGTAVITASQSGDANYNAAISVTQTLTVSKASQTISFAVLPTKVYGNADFAPGATSSAGLTISYTSSNTAVATIVSNQIHIVGAGSAVITASQSGDANYNAATSVTQTLTVSKAGQTISFTSLPAKVYGNADFAPGAAASSGLTVSYSSSNTAVATIVNNQIHIVGAGTSVITASQSGDANYNAAIAVTQTLTVSKASQTITFPALPTKVYGNANFSPGATASSGLTVSYTSSNTAVATIVSNQIKIVGAGTSTITARQAGNANYNAATSVSRTLTVSKASQTITFPTLPSKTVGDTDFSPGATASSGLTVSYTSSNTAVATIVNSKIHIVTAGTATITASQSGNTNYNAATSVSRTLTVTAALRRPAPVTNVIEQPSFSFYPNPASGYVTIAYSVGATTTVGMAILNLNGQLVQTCFSERKLPGRYTNTINVNKLTNAVYIGRFTKGDEVKIFKLMIGR